MGDKVTKKDKEKIERVVEQFTKTRHFRKCDIVRSKLINETKKNKRNKKNKITDHLATMKYACT